MTQPLPVAERYIHPGETLTIFCPSIADITAVERAEIEAGTLLSREIADSQGFNVRSNIVPAPDAGSKYTSSVIGRTVSDESSLTLYMDKGADDIRALMPRGTTGFLVFLYGGDVPETANMDVFPITVAGMPKEVTLAGEEVARVRLQVAITSEPVENRAIPTAE